jgi:hypothetical protein
MNETVYPAGIEFRQPRPRGAVAGAVLGGMLGFLLMPNAAGVITGSTLGGALANQPLPLDQAVRQRLTELGLITVNFYRIGHFTAKVLFIHKGTYWTLESQAPQTQLMTNDQIEDWLYGDLNQKVEQFLQNGAR